MSNAVRDDNQVTAKLGSFSGTTLRLMVEHATGYLKIKVKRATLAAPTTNPSIAAHDDNSVHSDLATFSSAPKAILAENATGYIRAIFA